MSLEHKAVQGVFWNSISRFSSYGIEFVIGIVLARLLSPKDFGIIGTLLMIVAFLEVFINSGFSQALIRDKDTSQIDYSTVFWFNLIIGVSTFGLLFITANYISNFLNNDDIESLVKILGLSLIVSSLTIIQRTILIKQINFKVQSTITIISTIVSGILAILAAFMNFGVWSLVVKILVFKVVESILFWFYSRWTPLFIFHKESLKRFFKFSSKLLISGSLDVLSKNVNYIIIAKFFSVETLGFYTRAEMFKNLPSQNLTAIVTTVMYPVLSSLKEDKTKLSLAFEKVFKNTYYISAVLMVVLLGISEPLILTLLGMKWLQTVPYLQLLCIVGIFNTVNSICANMLNVVGRSDLYLRLQLISQLLLIPSIAFGILFGMYYLLLGSIFNSIAMFFLFSWYSAKYISFGVFSQLKFILQKMALLFPLVLILLLANHFLRLDSIYTLLFQLMVSILYILLTGKIFRIAEYEYILSTIKVKLYARSER